MSSTEAKSVATNEVKPIELGDPNYDPTEGLLSRSFSVNDLDKLQAETALAIARAGQTDSETKKLDAQASRTKSRIQHNLVEGIMYGTVILFAGTCIISIFGACYPGADKEFLRSVMATIWDKWFQVILLVGAYYFGGVNGKA
jgi:hypothetical protein